MKRILNNLLLVLLFSTGIQTRSYAQEELNCFAIIAGRNATADGSVLFAHNEDDGGEQMLNVYISPKGLKLVSDKSVPATESRRSNKFLWFEFPRMEVADAALTERGLAIASNGCSSREDRTDISEGGILYELRLLVAQYALSARDAVKIMGAYVEKYGYRGSGRTYSVADPQEGWIFCVVKGRHWAAARIPDDKVMALPNNYILDKVDPSDTLNYYACADLISYAQQRGWYNPERDGEFSFKRAYCNPASYNNPRNYLRQRAVMELLGGRRLADNPDSLALFFTPSHKLTVQDMIDALSVHADGRGHSHRCTAPDVASHKELSLVCNENTILPIVFQLRSNLTVQVGAVAWVACGRACVEAFLPWYAGMTKVPEGFGRYKTPMEAYQMHFTDTKTMQQNYPSHFYWHFMDKWKRIAEDYPHKLPAVKSIRSEFQQRLFRRQQSFEKRMIQMLRGADRLTSIATELNNCTANTYREYMELDSGQTNLRVQPRI